MSNFFIQERPSKYRVWAGQCGYGSEQNRQTSLPFPSLLSSYILADSAAEMLTVKKGGLAELIKGLR